MTVNELIQQRHDALAKLISLCKELRDIRPAADGVVAHLKSLESAMLRLRQALDVCVSLGMRDLAQFQAQLDEFMSKVQEALRNLPAMLDELQNTLDGFQEEIGKTEQQGGFAPLKLMAQLQELARWIEELSNHGDVVLALAALARDIVARLETILPQLEMLSRFNPQGRSALREVRAVLQEVKNAEGQVQASATSLQMILNETQARLQPMPGLLRNYQQQLDALLGRLEKEVPLALLPVRLETRFVDTELLLRIYPDDIHQDSHEWELNHDEVKWGQHFWEQTWRAGTNASLEQKQKRLAAWSQLAQRFGPRRAAWIARVLEPKNQVDRPVDPILDEKTPLRPTPNFPQPLSRNGSWTRAPHAKVLPDRWVALGYVNKQRVFIEWGELIPDPLPTGPSPAAKKPDAGLVDEGMKWMVDFDEAVKKGMGIRVQLTSEQALKGLDRLVVLGVKATLDTKDSSQRLHDLLEAHHYTWGLGLAPQGTPTNNTPEVKSGYAKRDPGFEGSFATECEKALCTFGDDSDADLAARALGLESPGQNSPFVFAHVPHANAHDQQDARNMNTVLWPATLGYLLTQLMEETFTKIDSNNRKFLDWNQYLAWRRYFIDHVRACGPLPALRIANQPYGLLPVSSLESWSHSSQPWPGTTIPLIELLRNLRKVWHNALSAVPRLAADVPDPDDQFVKILGMEAASAKFYARRLLGPRYTESLWSFLLGTQLDGSWWPKHDGLVSEGLESVGLGQLDHRLNRSSFAVEDFEIKAPLVQEQPVSETEPLVKEQNYIAWLTTANPKEIHDQTFFQDPNKPKPLLYRLLRHATLQAYAEAALQKKPVEPPLVDPELVDMPDPTQEQSREPTRTLWRHLVDARTSDSSRWRPDLPNPEAGDREFKEFRGSLIALSQLPSATLQRLLRESLDLCAYRLDAWITSCVTQRLTEMRDQQKGGKPIGIQLGGFGWVENLRPAIVTALYQLWNPGLGDHFYTTSLFERDAAATRLGYDSEGIACYVFKSQVEGATPLYRLWHTVTSDHFYTTKVEERDKAIAVFGYRDQGTACYVFNTEVEGTTPLYRLWNPANSDHYYTIDAAARDQAIAGKGYTDEGIACYVFASKSAGFVHAPSLAHAATAAVLRSGYLSHRDSGNGEALAIDLSSRRVRLAKWLIDGVRNGQPLGALLGYRFERGLHENHPGRALDQYIAAFRDLAPLVAGKQIPKNNEPATSIAANNVVDGLKLLRRWRENTIPFGQPIIVSETVKIKIPDAGDEYKAIIEELKALEDATDAISDVAIAESVYHAMQGNPLRSGASLDAISRGEVPPQELEVARTPRTGIGLTHRLLVLFSGNVDPKYTSEWDPQVRATAEPHLNAWAARLLGNPNNVLCQVKYQYADPVPPHSKLQYTRELSLKELGPCPLDILYASLVTEQAQRSDLEQWLIYHALKTRNSSTNKPKSPGNIPANAEVELIFKRDSNWPAEKISFPELLEVARAARELISSARAIDARDVAQPGQGVLPEIDLDKLKGRADSAKKDLQEALTKLHNLLAPTNPDLDQLREALLQFAYFGIEGAVPLSPAGNTSEDQATLVKQARALADNVSQRLERIDKIKGITADDELVRLREVFGPGFRIMPQFAQTNEINTTLERAFALRNAAQDTNPQQVIPWFQRIARIRDGAARLDAALMYAEALGAGDSLNFRVAQLPAPDKDVDRWVGLDVNPMPGGRLSLAVHTPLVEQTSVEFPLKDAEEKPVLLAGLLIDEWVEVVPNASETTAVTFHYDAPGACPPQAVLLAVHPVPHQPWNLETLEAVLLETMDLAKLRAVDPDALAKTSPLGHYLPALYFAYKKGGDPNGDTIATDFKS